MAQRIAFYSFKGGVGRTLALLNVAVTLARAGLRIVAVDMDLEAPGFHRFPAIRPADADHPGVSDYILDRLDGPELDVERFAYRPSVDGVADRLLVVPAGTRPRELAERIPAIYAPLGERALIFQLFAARLEVAFSPDVILLDSRTGLAEVAAVCTVDLADAIVALTGLNPQGYGGLADVVERIRRHPARRRPPAFILAYSPVPTIEPLDGESPSPGLDPLGRPNPTPRPLLTRFAEMHAVLWREAVESDASVVRKWFPLLGDEDRLHFLRYDPWVPLVAEEGFDRRGPLWSDHQGLARSVARSAGHDILAETRPRAGAAPHAISRAAYKQAHDR